MFQESTTSTSRGSSIEFVNASAQPIIKAITITVKQIIKMSFVSILASLKLFFLLSWDCKNIARKYMYIIWG